MLGSQLRALASAGDVARVDLGQSPLLLSPTPEHTTVAWYAGYGISCGVIIEGDELEHPVAVSAPDFKAITALYPPKEPVSIKALQSSLRVTGADRRSLLRYTALSEDRLMDYTTARVALPYVRVSLKLFAAELEAAVEGAATSMAAPILTGVRLVGRKRAIGVQSYNGSSLAFYSQFEADEYEEVFTGWEVVVPAYDLQAALKVLKGDSVAVAQAGHNLILNTETVVVRLSTLAGSWPIRGAIQPGDIREELTLSRDALTGLAAAAEVYDRSEVLIDPWPDSGVRLSIPEGERGAYEEIVEGSLSNRYVVSAADLAVLGKASTGDALMLRFTDRMVCLQAGPRSLYAQLRWVR